MRWARDVRCLMGRVRWLVRCWTRGFFGRVETERGREFVNFSVDLDESIQGHINMPNRVGFVKGEEISDEVVLAGIGGVDLSKEDFGHVGEAFCEDFDGLALLVRVIQTLAFKYLTSHFEAYFACDPCRFIGESLECHALFYPLCRLQRYRDLAGRRAIGRIVLRLQEGLAFAVELGESVQVTQGVIPEDGSLLRVTERPHEGFDCRGGRFEGRGVGLGACDVDVGYGWGDGGVEGVSGDGEGGSARCFQHLLGFEVPCCALIARSGVSMRRRSGGHDFGCITLFRFGWDVQFNDLIG